MAECRKIKKLLPLAVYNETSPEEYKILEKHLASCSRCKEEYKRVKQTLDIMDKRERKDPGPEFWEQFIPKLNRSIQKASAENRIAEKPLSRKRLGWRLFWQTATGAALVILGIFLGKFIWMPPEASLENSLASASAFHASLSSMSIQDKFEKMHVVLMSIMNFNPEQEDPYALNLIGQQRLFKELAVQTSEIQQSAFASSDDRVYRLASDLELILRQMANVENPQNPQNIKMIQSALTQKDILFRLRLFNIRYQRKAVPAHTSPVI
jgi:hypothetical protein